MPTRVEQTEAMEAGHVRLICAQPRLLDAGSVEIGIARLDRGTPHFLDPLALGEPHWVAGERWFRPDVVRPEGTALTFELGPALSWRLKPHATYLLHLRDGAGARVEDRLAWPAVRLPSTPPDPEPAVPAAPPPPPPPAPEPPGDDLAAFAVLAAGAPPSPEPPPVEEQVQERERRPVTEPTGGRSYVLPLALALLVLVVAAGGAYWWYANRTPSPQVAQAPAQDSIPLTLQGARDYLTKQKPPAADAAREAARFQAAGQADAAFLLYREAARGGDVPSMLAIARMYDPDTFKQGQGPVAKADPDEASTWYEMAANKGDVSAMQRLSTLLKNSQVTRPDAAERATFWAQKAKEAQGAGTASQAAGGSKP